MSIGDAGDEIVAGVEQALPLVGADLKEWAATLSIGRTVTRTCWKSVRRCAIR
jgi:hypothetical protein